MDGSVERSTIPVTHRAVATSCEGGAPPPTSCVASGTQGAQSNCTLGSDCTAGANGRCLAETFLPLSDVRCTCAYDLCVADPDCGPTALCQCATANPRGLGNHCLVANCRTDADCGEGGFCSPSRGEITGYWNASSPDSFTGYYCHTAADTCVNDTDCTVGPYGAHCAFDHSKQAWACFSYWTS